MLAESETFLPSKFFLTKNVAILCFFFNYNFHLNFYKVKKEKTGVVISNDLNLKYLRFITVPSTFLPVM